MGVYQKMVTKMTPQGKFDHRYQLVRFAREYGIKPAAREFRTYPKVVRCWVGRYEEQGLVGLHDRSRAPKTHPNQCPPSFEKTVVKLRLKTKHKFGAVRLKERFELDFGKSCIQRILSQQGLKRKKKTVKQKRNELWSTKKLMAVFEKIQVDVKELIDIPLYLAAYQKHILPRYEFTARCVKTGATFVCFANQNTNLNAAVFMAYLLDHLKVQGFDLSKIEIQTDNGSEFNAAGRKKQGLLPFEFIVKEVFSVKLTHIPPASPTFNSDVETFHRLVEDEFYAIEPFSSVQDLIQKAYTYLIEFNFLRSNSYKDRLAPIQLAIRDNPDFNSQLFNLPPILLDHHFHLYTQRLPANPNHIPSPVSIKDAYSLRTGLPDPFLSPDWDVFTRFSAFPPGGYYVPGLHR